MIESILDWIFVGAILGFIIGKLAVRKNRNGWLWGIIFGTAITVGATIQLTSVQSANPLTGVMEIGSALFCSWIIAMIVLAFKPFLCPKCKEKLNTKQWKEKTCPRCGQLTQTIQ